MAAEAVENTVKPARGRPKKFDRATALRQAMKLFWERGYEGTSFDDLIGAMGISPSSFYNSFASKERLYQEASREYVACASTWFAGKLGAATDTKTAFQRLLNAAARELVGGDFEARTLANTPLGRVGRPEDIAAAVAFMASDDASWITGESLVVAGGNGM